MTIDNQIDSIPAIVLAGGKKRPSVAAIRQAIEDLWYYGELYLFLTKYKAVKPVKGSLNGVFDAHSLVLYSLYSLSRVERVPHIVVVGPQYEIEDALEKAPFDSGKIEVVEQVGSMGQNLKEGYERVGSQGHALIMTGDAPTTSTKCIDDFLDIAFPLCDHDLIFPLVKKSLMQEVTRLFPRKHVYFDPEGTIPEDYIEDEDRDPRGRVGFRITSLAVANLEKISAGDIDYVRSLRKMVRPSVREQLKRDFADRVRADFGVGVLDAYRSGIPISWMSELVYDLYGKTLQVVGLDHPAATLDADSPFDFRAISRYLQDNNVN